MRQIILDTETTGLSPKQGHRVIEIGCVEMINRQLTGNNFHHYINPDREIDAGAQAVHGITAAFLSDKPMFADIAKDFLSYLDGAELVIHNAPFDMGFLNAELKRVKRRADYLSQLCPVVDTLVLARKKHPGQRNSLDALCQRYHVNNANRQLHGALLDAQILADVYLALTGGQSTMFDRSSEKNQASVSVAVSAKSTVRVVKATEEESAIHQTYLREVLQIDDA